MLRFIKFEWKKPVITIIKKRVNEYLNFDSLMSFIKFKFLTALVCIVQHMEVQFNSI